MATSSILGGEHAPAHPRGNDIDSLGPSNTSDSGSDVQTDRNHAALDEGEEGALPIAHGSDSDAAGTGERASADPVPEGEAADIMPDRIGVVPDDSADALANVDDPGAASVDELALDGEDIDADGEDSDDGADAETDKA